MTEFYYRYYDSSFLEEITIGLEKFRVVKYTPKGVWIETYAYPTKRKFVLNDARVRYAYPTKELAENSYRKRKEHQRWHLWRALKRNMLVRKKLKEGLIETDATVVKAAPSSTLWDW